MNIYNAKLPLYKIIALYVLLLGIAILLYIAVPFFTLGLPMDMTSFRMFFTSFSISSAALYSPIFLITCSLGLFLAKKWARLLLSIMFHVLLLGCIVFAVLYFFLFGSDPETRIFFATSGIGFFLATFSTCIFAIIILHSSKIKEELNYANRQKNNLKLNK